MSKKIILHLCADIGSDTRYYQLDPAYEVILVGKEIGVENFDPPDNVHGIYCNPVCTEFSILKGFDHVGDLDKGMFLVNHCLRIVNHPKVKKTLKWHVTENPAKGRLKQVLGTPNAKYQPWWYGSAWTKETALWGQFVMPERKYYTWESVPKIPELYMRPGRNKPNLAYLHKSAAALIPEMAWAIDRIKTDADLRSWCSQPFAEVFYKSNP